MSLTPVRLPFLAAVLFAAGCGGGGGDLSSPPPGNPPDDGIAVEPVFSQLSFTAPVALLQAPADPSRWFVVQQDGRIRVFDNQSNVANSTEFADLRSRVDDSASESGLLGMAFHPDFAQNGEVYLSFTETGTPFVSVIARYQVAADGNTLNTATEEVLYRVPQDAGNHNGGQLAFGPDGMLYIGFGDGGGSGDPNNRAQNTSNVLGSILRLDVDGLSPYEIPNGNPFAGNTECSQGFGSAPCPEIYAWGLRNPWRFSFDRQGGQLWAGDVGQGSWEEVNRIDAGQNYGWRQREGAHCFNPASGCSTANVDPISEYPHSVGQSVTGGYVYRGDDIPGLVGHYLFADFVSGVLFSVPANAGQATAAEQRLGSDLNIASFGEDAEGELYLLDYGAGRIYRVAAAP